MKIDDIILNRCIAKGEKSEIYLASRDNDITNYIAKKYERENVEKTQFMTLLKNDIIFLQNLKHPNIINFVCIKKTKRNYYVICEYCNGGKLSTILDNYEKELGKPFSQEIIQYIMKQIIDAFIYLHSLKITHNNINLNNILINYKNEKDEEEFNLLKSKIKIIDFKYAKKFNLKEGPIGYIEQIDKDNKKDLYKGKDSKNDILQIGKLCFKMLFGKYSLDDNIDNMEKIIDEIENGKYNYPITLSKEIISFLKDIIRKDHDKRLNINELSKHDFILKYIKDFQLINEQKDEYKIKEEHLCVVCITNNQEIILCPCGHKCICENCYYKLKNKNKISECPVCRYPIESILRKVIEV